MATKEQRQREKAERKARWKQAQTEGTGAWEPKPWRKSNERPKVLPIDVDPELVKTFFRAQRSMRQG